MIQQLQSGSAVHSNISEETKVIMTIKELKQKLVGDKSVIVKVYAPAEGYENNYYYLGLREHEFQDSEILGYEYFEDETLNELLVVLKEPIYFTKVSVLAYFINGNVYELSSPIKLGLQMQEITDFWSVKYDSRTGEPWPDDTQTDN